MAHSTKNYSLLFLGLIFTVNAVCQMSAVPVINRMEEYRLKSEINGNSYPIFVSLPQHYSSTDTTRYPVLYVLDGNIIFPIAHTVRQMMDLYGELEDVIIVGIGYTWDESYVPWMTKRWKDYTPSSVINADTSRAFLSIFNLKPGDLASGGAKLFMEILKSEVFPFVEKKYKTNNDRGIAGHSLSGLFAAHCLLQDPRLFNRFGINSPSLWWDNRKILETEKLFSESHQELNAKVFISVGGTEGRSMVPMMTAFADSLKFHHYAGLQITSHVFENESHMSVIPASVSRMIKVLYQATGNK